MNFKEYLKNKLATDEEFRKSYTAWSFENLKMFIENKIELWKIRFRKIIMKKKIHNYLRGSNNPILIWIKYWDIFDDCWDYML